MRASSAVVDPARILDEAIAALKNPEASFPIADVDRALLVAPHDPRLWHVKGLMHRAQERRELAIPALRRAVELAPNEPLIMHGLARTLLEAGLPSVDEFARAMKLAPDKPEVVMGMVAALMADGRVEAAIEGLEIALRKQPLWVAGQILLSEVRWSEGAREGFTSNFDEAIALHPNSLDLRREQLNLLIHAEQFDAVLERLADARNLSGDDRMFLSHEATARAETGDFAEADRLFERLIPFANSKTEMRRVRHLLKSGRPVEAAEAIEPWLTQPENEVFWPYAASAWRLIGDPRSNWLEGDQRFIGVYDLTESLPPLDGLADTLRKLHTSRSQPLVQSVRGGTQTDGILFQRIEPEIVALREAIRDAVRKHAEALPPVDETHPLLRWRPKRIEFTGSWSVRLTGGGSHSIHVHPMGWLSSALYLVVPPNLDDDAGSLVLGESPPQIAADLPPHHQVQPKPGLLALFPSWMWHGTRPFGEGERMTVAFDVARS